MFHAPQRGSAPQIATAPAVLCTPSYTLVQVAWPPWLAGPTKRTLLAHAAKLAQGGSRFLLPVGLRGCMFAVECLLADSAYGAVGQVRSAVSLRVLSPLL